MGCKDKYRKLIPSFIGGLRLNPKVDYLSQWVSYACPIQNPTTGVWELPDKTGDRGGEVLETNCLLGDGIAYIQFPAGLESTSFTYFDGTTDQVDTTDVSGQWVIPDTVNVGNIRFETVAPFANWFLCDESSGTTLLNRVQGGSNATLVNGSAANWDTNNKFTSYQNELGYSEGGEGDNIFTGNPGSWIKYNTVDNNVGNISDGIVDVDNTLKVYSTVNDDQHYIRNNLFLSTQNYTRVRYKFYIPASNTNNITHRITVAGGPVDVISSTIKNLSTGILYENIIDGIGLINVPDGYWYQLDCIIDTAAFSSTRLYIHYNTQSIYAGTGDPFDDLIYFAEFIATEYMQSTQLIPAQIDSNGNSTGLDAIGNPLQYKGRVKYNQVIKGSWYLNLTTGNEYLAATDLSGWSIESWKGSTTPTINGDNIELTIGTLSELVLNDGTRLHKYTVVSGNLTKVYDTQPVNSQHLTITNATTPWQQDVTGLVRPDNWIDGAEIYDDDVTHTERIYVPFRTDGSRITPTIAGYSKIGEVPPCSECKGIKDTENTIEQYPSNGTQHPFWYSDPATVIPRSFPEIPWNDNSEYEVMADKSDPNCIKNLLLINRALTDQEKFNVEKFLNHIEPFHVQEGQYITQDGPMWVHTFNFTG